MKLNQSVGTIASVRTLFLAALAALFALATLTVVLMIATTQASPPEYHATATTKVGNFVGVVLRPTALTGTVDDWAPTGLADTRTILVATSGAATLNSLTGGADGRRLDICNAGTFALTIANEGTGTAVNKFALPDGLSWILEAAGNACVQIVYDATALRWKMDAKTGTTFPIMTVTGAATVGGTLGVTGTTTLSGNALLNGAANTIGDSATDLTTFSNGPSGINTYSGTHLEWSDDFMATSQSLNNASFANAYNNNFSGTAAQITINVGTTTRPGIMEYTSGSTSTGRCSGNTDFAGIDFGSGTWMTEWVGGVPVLSTVADAYALVFGFGDVQGINPVDGCYFLYDRENAATGNINTTNLNNWECVCANGSARTFYIMNGVGNSDESFPLGNAPVAALTLPSTNINHLKVQMTGTTRAEFFVSGVKMCDINTNIPSGASNLTGGELGFLKSNGATATKVDSDYIRLTVDLNAARSP